MSAGFPGTNGISAVIDRRYSRFDALADVFQHPAKNLCTADHYGATVHKHESQSGAPSLLHI
jgi:hypothetical protein